VVFEFDGKQRRDWDAAVYLINSGVKVHVEGDVAFLVLCNPKGKRVITALNSSVSILEVSGSSKVCSSSNR
jgi:hypothetical protein